MAEPALKLCVQCGLCAAKMSKCSICHQKFQRRVHYCSQECQKKDWPSHKNTHKEGVNAEIKLTALAINQVDEQGMTFLMRKSLEGDFEEVVKLIGDGANLTLSESQGLTALHFAIASGHQKVVEYILENGPKSILGLVTAPPRSESLLSFAARLPNAGVVEALLRKGGSSLLLANDKPEINALGIACLNSNVDVLKLIIDADCASGGLLMDRFGPAALVCACIYRRRDAVQQLIEAGGKEILRTPSQNEGSLDKWTSLMVASRIGDLEIVRLLAAAGGRELLLRTTDTKANCLLLALREGHVEVAQHLLGVPGGAELVRGECLRWAVEFGSLDVVKRLVQAGGADAVLHRLPSGTTCLFVAAQVSGRGGCAARSAAPFTATSLFCVLILCFDCTSIIRDSMPPGPVLNLWTRAIALIRSLH